MEQVGGFGGVGDQLNGYYAFAGNPAYFNEDFSRYRALSPSDITAAAARFLPTRQARRADRWSRFPMSSPRRFSVVTRRWALWLVALTWATAAVGLSAQQAPRSFASAGARSAAGAAPAGLEKRTLSNGLQVWVVGVHKVPTVNSSSSSAPASPTIRRQVRAG